MSTLRGLALPQAARFWSMIAWLPRRPCCSASGR